MPDLYEEMQALVDILKHRSPSRAAFKTERKTFLPTLQALEDRMRAELRLLDEASAVETHEELVNRFTRKRGKYQACLKQIDAIQEAMLRLNKILFFELDPMLDEYAERVVEKAGYEDPEG